MVSFRPNKSQEPDAFFFEIKVGLLLIGAGIGIAGMVTERRGLVWIGILFVGAGIVLRLVQTRMHRNKDNAHN